MHYALFALVVVGDGAAAVVFRVILLVLAAATFGDGVNCSTLGPPRGGVVNTQANRRRGEAS